MRRTQLLGATLAFVVAGCAHYDAQGRAVRTGPARFDAKSVTAPGTSYTLQQDGTWAGLGGDRYLMVGDDIRKEEAFGPTPSLIRPSSYVAVDRRPDGLSYTPSYPGGRIWTFVTEDGGPLPRDLEVPLYLAAQLGLSGQWISMHVPGSEVAGIPLDPDCSIILFDIQGRQVAGWVARQGAVCPTPRYLGSEVLARLNGERNEVWESSARPFPQN